MLGLPLHPLIVHLAVVFLPVSALAAIAIVIRPAWSKRFGILVVGGSLVGAVAAFISRASGQQLALQVGVSGEHLNYGTLLPLVALGFLALVGTFWLFDRGVPGNRSRPLWLKFFGAVVVLASVGVIALTVVTGHSGSEMVWSSIGGSTAAAQ